MHVPTKVIVDTKMAVPDTAIVTVSHSVRLLELDSVVEELVPVVVELDSVVVVLVTVAVQLNSKL